MNAAELWSALDRVGFGTLRMLLSVLWQSSLLLLAVWLIGVALRRRRAAVRHALWAGALLAMPLIPLLAWAASGVGAPQAEVAVMPAYRPMPAAFEPMPAEPLPAAPTIQEAPEPEAVGLRLLDYPWALGLIAYASGAAGILALVALGRLRIRRWVRAGRQVVDPDVLLAFSEAWEELGLAREVRVLESDTVPTPITVGVFRPQVLLPEGLLITLSAGETRAVALHELAHVRRRDPLVLGLVSLLRALLFFHPLVWVAARQVAHLAEDAADDAVLDAGEAPVPYAGLLTRLAEELPRRAISTELAAGIVLTRSAFFRRIQAILSDRREEIRRLTHRVLAGTVIAALVSLGVALALPLGERAETVSARPRVEPEDAARQVVEALSKGDLGKAEAAFITREEFARTFAGAEADRAYEKLHGLFVESLKLLGPELAGARFVRMDMHFAREPVKVPAGKNFGMPGLDLREDTWALDNVQAVINVEGREGSLILDAMVEVNGSWRLLSPLDIRLSEPKTVAAAGLDHQVVRGLATFRTAERAYRAEHGSYAEQEVLAREGLFISPDDFAKLPHVSYGEFRVVDVTDSTFTVEWTRPAAGPASEHPHACVGMDQDGKITRSDEAPSAPEGVCFGPVIERVVNDDSVQADVYVDFDTGKLFTRPDDVLGFEKNVKWFRDRGIDALCDIDAPVSGLVGIDMVVHPFSAEVQMWERMTARNLKEQEFWTFARPGFPVYFSAVGDLPATYAFKTREGGMGILQIVGFTEDPPGVKIRYKMVQGADGSGPVARVTLPSIRPAVDRSERERAEIELFDLRAMKTVKIGIEPGVTESARDDNAFKAIIRRVDAGLMYEDDNSGLTAIGGAMMADLKDWDGDRVLTADSLAEFVIAEERKRAKGSWFRVPLMRSESVDIGDHYGLLAPDAGAYLVRILAITDTPPAVGLEVRKLGRVDMDSLLPEAPGAAAAADDELKERLMGQVEEFFAHNFRDVKQRKTVAWGEVSRDEDGSYRIPYTYEARIWNSEPVLFRQVFTFDADGDYIRVETDRSIRDGSRQELIGLVEHFFGKNYRDITARKTVEWGDVTRGADGNYSIRYRYEATIRNKDRITRDQVFTFDPDGAFIRVTDPAGAEAERLTGEHLEEMSGGQDWWPDVVTVTPGGESQGGRVFFVDEVTGEGTAVALRVTAFVLTPDVAERMGFAETAANVLGVSPDRLTAEDPDTVTRTVEAGTETRRFLSPRAFPGWVRSWFDWRQTVLSHPRVPLPGLPEGVAVRPLVSSDCRYVFVEYAVGAGEREPVGRVAAVQDGGAFIMCKGGLAAEQLARRWLGEEGMAGLQGKPPVVVLVLQARVTQARQTEGPSAGAGAQARWVQVREQGGRIALPAGYGPPREGPAAGPQIYVRMKVIEVTEQGEKVISSPNMILADGQTATIDTTRTIAEVLPDLPDDVLEKFGHQKVGTSVTVTPRMVQVAGPPPQTMIELDIEYSLREVAGHAEGTGAPVLNVKEFSTSVRVPDGVEKTVSGLEGEGGAPGLKFMVKAKVVALEDTRAEEQAEVRVYPVRDLVLSPEDEGLAADEAEAAAREGAEELARLFRGILGVDAGGSVRASEIKDGEAAPWVGVLESDPGVITVRASREQHKRMEECLKALRKSLEVHVQLEIQAFVLERGAVPPTPLAETGLSFPFKDAQWFKTVSLMLRNGQRKGLPELGGAQVRPVASHDRAHVFLEVDLLPAVEEPPELGNARYPFVVADGGAHLLLEDGPLAPLIARAWVGEEAAEGMDLDGCAVALLAKPRLIILEEVRVR